MLSNAQLRAALSDTAVPGTVAASGDARPPRGQSLRRGAPRGRLRVWRRGRAGGHVRPGLAGHRIRHLAEGQDDEPVAQPHGVAPTGRRLRHRRPRGHVHATSSSRSRTTSSALRGSSRRRRSSGRRLTDRDLAVEARQGLVTQLVEGKVPAATLGLVRYVVAGGRARDFVGHARLPGRGRRPRPAAGASPGSPRRRRSTTRSAARCPSRSAHSPVRRSSCRSRSTSHC